MKKATQVSLASSKHFRVLLQFVRAGLVIGFVSLYIWQGQLMFLILAAIIIVGAVLSLVFKSAMRKKVQNMVAKAQTLSTRTDARASEEEDSSDGDL